MATARNFEVTSIYLFTSANIYTGLPIFYSRLLTVCDPQNQITYILIY
jgi:hypothetical protein